jgi:hypothetical protein
MTTFVRSLTPDEIATYHSTGVVLLRGVLDLAAVNLIRRSIDEAAKTLADSEQGYDLSQLTRAVDHNDQATIAAADGGQHNVSAVVEHIRASGKPMLYDPCAKARDGRFLLDTAVTSRVSALRRFAHKGPVAEIGGQLMRSNTVRFFADQMFVKEPGTRERTAYHQDASYYEIEGDQCCVLWIPVDPVTLENGAMQYVRGSHKTGTLYRPNVFVSQTALPGSEGATLPDIEGNPEAHDLVHFNVEPGDIIVHHYKTIHGSGGNLSRYQPRRALTIRYCGDDIRFKARPGVPRQLKQTTPVIDGAPLDGVDFPVVWRLPSARAVA